MNELLAFLREKLDEESYAAAQTMLDDVVDEAEESVGMASDEVSAVTRRAVRIAKRSIKGKPSATTRGIATDRARSGPTFDERFGTGRLGDAGTVYVPNERPTVSPGKSFDDRFGTRHIGTAT